MKIERKKIIDDFEDRMNDKTVQNKKDLKNDIMNEIRFLKKKAHLQTSNEQFLAFRNYIINEGIMHQIIKSVLEK